ncbi:MAG: hypothetical protein HGA51_09325, partial [Demequinaceae bacterium]|nr:hypothetical protein [Demequinaceae bacterium]
MRPTRTVSLSSAVVLALSLVAASLVFLAPQSRAATSTLYDLDFEAGSYAPWIASGGPALAVIDDGTGANKVLDVTNRVNAYDTISSPVGDFVEGTPYTFSFDIKASVATDLRLVVNEPGAANEYVWVGNTSASAGAWTTVTGTFTLGAGAASAKVYIDVTDLTDFQVDNVLVTSEVVPPAPTAVTAVDFNDGTSGTWTQSGGDGSTLTYVADPEDGANTVLSVARTDNYVGIQSPASIFVADETYTFSMRVRLANPADGTTSVRFVMKPAYDWIANTGGVSGSGWTTVTGSFTVPAAGDTTQLQAYIGTDDASVAGAAYTYLVDDILVTAASSGG